MSNTDKPTTRAELLRQLEASWNKLQTYLASLTEAQLTQPTDAAGWTAKDHIMHIAVFDAAELAVLERKSKREELELPLDMWERGDDDEINGVIQGRYHNLPLAKVMMALLENHTNLLQKMESMTEADYQLPHSHYQSDSTDQRAILEWIPWDTYHHYNDHIPWIAAIVGKQPN